MLGTPKELWAACLRMISNNITPEKYKAWFETIEFESYSEAERKLLVRVPSSFVYEYIEENFIDLLRKVLFYYFGPGVKLMYRVLTDSTNNITQTVQSDPGADIEAPKKLEGVNKAPNILDAQVPQQIDSDLNKHLTFDNFIEGRSNKMPRSIGMAIADNPFANTFNPLFVYGPSGCGKTHLVNAIGVRIKEKNPEKRVLYVSARIFQKQYTDSVLHNTSNDFISFYQTIDVLIVDDIQEWIGVTKTQDTFFHIFNHLFRNNRRIILACDRPPVEMSGMNERLLTRFKCGLTAELERPDEQLCVDILNSLIQRDGLRIPMNVVNFIAESVRDSVRDLHGVVNSLLAYSVVYNSPIDMKLAESVLKRAVQIDNSPLTVDDIIEKVCGYFNVSQDGIATKSRKRELVTARQVSMYLAQKYTKLPAQRIGKLVGGRDHSTVIHSCNQVEQRMQSDANFKKDIDSIVSSFKLKI